MPLPPIKIPARVRTGDPVRAADYNLILDALRAIVANTSKITVGSSADIAANSGPSGTTLTLKNREVGRNTLPPLWPVLGIDNSGPSPAYYVTVTDGMVIERRLTKSPSEDATYYWECPSVFDEDGNLDRIPIEAGQAVYVRVFENADGSIAAPDETTYAVDVVVATEASTKSVNTWNVDEAPVQGVYYYKLAELQVTGGKAELVRFAAGSHVYHDSGVTVDVILEDCDADPYADPPVAATQLIRLSFLSGRLVGVNESESARPLYETVERVNVQSCHWVDDPPT